MMVDVSLDDEDDQLSALPGTELTLGDAWTLGHRLGDRMGRVSISPLQGRSTGTGHVARPQSVLSLASSAPSPSCSRPATRDGLVPAWGAHMGGLRAGTGGFCVPAGATLSAAVRSGTTTVAGPPSTARQPERWANPAGGCDDLGVSGGAVLSRVDPIGGIAAPVAASREPGAPTLTPLEMSQNGLVDSAISRLHQQYHTQQQQPRRQEPLQQPTWGQARPAMTRPGSLSQPTPAARGPAAPSPYFDGWGARRNTGREPSTVVMESSRQRVPVVRGSAPAQAGSSMAIISGSGSMVMTPTSTVLGPTRAGRAQAGSMVNLWAQAELVSCPSTPSLATAATATGGYRDPMPFSQLLRRGSASGSGDPPASHVVWAPPSQIPAPMSPYSKDSSNCSAGAANAAAGQTAAFSPQPHTPALLSSGASKAAARLPSSRLHTVSQSPFLPEQPQSGPQAAGANSVRMSTLSPSLTLHRLEPPRQALGNVMQVHSLRTAASERSVPGTRGSSPGPMQDDDQPEAEAVDGGDGRKEQLLSPRRSMTAPSLLPTVPHFTPLPTQHPPLPVRSLSTWGLSFGTGSRSGANSPARIASPRSPRHASPPRQAPSPEACATVLHTQSSAGDPSALPLHTVSSPRGPPAAQANASTARGESGGVAASSLSCGTPRKPVPYSAARAPIMSPRGTSSAKALLGTSGALQGRAAGGASVAHRDSGDGRASAQSMPSPHPEATLQPSQSTMSSEQPAPRMGEQAADAPFTLSEQQQQPAEVSVESSFSLRRSMYADWVESTPLAERLGAAAGVVAGGLDGRSVVLKRQLQNRTTVYYKPSNTRRLLGDVLRMT